MITITKQAGKTYLITITKNSDNSFDQLQLPNEVDNYGRFSVLEGEVQYLIGALESNLDLNSKFYNTVRNSVDQRVELDRQFSTLNRTDELFLRSINSVSHISFISA